jgi:vacuolar-type H+-ATPase subunit I/STV1
MACRLKEDQLQSQKHQIENQLKNLGETSARLAELERKEKISEWVPKLEFNRLNEEYTRLEKELGGAEEKIKNYAAEIVHLRQSAEKKASSGKEVVPAEDVPPAPEEAPLSLPQQEESAAEKPPETPREEDKAVRDGAPPEEKQQNQERQNNEG